MSFFPAARRKLSRRPFSSRKRNCSGSVVSRCRRRRGDQKRSVRRTAFTGSGRKRAHGLRDVSTTTGRGGLPAVSASALDRGFSIVSGEDIRVIKEGWSFLYLSFGRRPGYNGRR